MPTGGSWPKGYAVRADGDQAQVLKSFVDATGVTYFNSGTAATPALDDASPFGGRRLRVDCPVGNTYTEVQLHSGISVQKFPDGRSLYFRLWLEDWQSVTQLMVFAGVNGYTRLLQNTWTVQNNNLNNRSGPLSIPLNSNDTTADNFNWGVDAVENVKVRIFTRAGFAARVWLDEFGIAARSRPKILITFDDASKSWMDYARSELASRGLRATFGVGTGQVGTNASLYVSAADLLSLQSDGHQICAHNVTNTAYGYTAASLAAYLGEYDFAVDQLRGWGIVGPFNYHPFVQGLHDQALIDGLLARGVRVMRGVDVKTSSACRFNFPTCGNARDNAVSLKIGSYSPGLSLVNANAHVTNLLKFGGTYVAMFHDLTTGVASGVQWPVPDFQSWLNNVVSLRDLGCLDVMTAGDWETGLTQPSAVKF